LRFSCTCRSQAKLQRMIKRTNSPPSFPPSTLAPLPLKNVKKIPNFHPSKHLSFPQTPSQVQKMHNFHASHKSLTLNHFRFLYIFQPSKKRLFEGSKATNEAVKDGKWAAQKPLLTASKATNGNLKEANWRLESQKMELQNANSPFFII
jgi:hypothetical protein